MYPYNFRTLAIILLLLIYITVGVFGQKKGHYKIVNVFKDSWSSFNFSAKNVYGGSFGECSNYCVLEYNGDGVCPAYTEYNEGNEGGAICQPGSIEQCALVLDDQEVTNDTTKIAFNKENYTIETVIGVSAVGSGKPLEPIDGIVDGISNITPECLSKLSPPAVNGFDQETNPINFQGWILICGGIRSQPHSCHKWRPGLAEWIKFPMNEPHGCRGLANFGENGAAVLGLPGDTGSQKFEVFLNGTWEPKRDFPKEVCHTFMAAKDDNTLFVLGVKTEDEVPTPFLYRYDLGDDSWTPLEDQGVNAIGNDWANCAKVMMKEEGNSAKIRPMVVCTRGTDSPRMFDMTAEKMDLMEAKPAVSLPVGSVHFVLGRRLYRYRGYHNELETVLDSYDSLDLNEWVWSNDMSTVSGDDKQIKEKEELYRSIMIKANVIVKKN